MCGSAVMPMALVPMEMRWPVEIAPALRLRLSAGHGDAAAAGDVDPHAREVTYVHDVDESKAETRGDV